MSERKEYMINLCWDKEAFVWVATSDVLCIAFESDSIDILIERVKLAVPELLSLNNVLIQKSVYLCFSIRCEL